MKKYCFILVALLGLGIETGLAQYKIILDFDSANGDWPDNPLTISGRTLYGTAAEGGAYGKGCIFSIDTSGNRYRDLLDFNGANGDDPFSSLILSGKVLYGVTAEGGARNMGCIFSIDTNGDRYKDLLDFNDTNGLGDEHTLTLAGKTLYGTTYIGSVGGHGRMFSIDTTGNGYRDLLDTSIDGSSLTLSGGVFYGTSSGTGTYGVGTIFSVDTNGKNYKDLFDFNDTNGGPWTALTLSKGVLYGISSGEDSIHNEFLFSIDTNGSNFKELYILPRSNPFLSPSPNCPLVLSGNKLYVITSYGGANFQGNVFSVDTNGNLYSDIFDFDGTKGGEPFATMIISEGVLYGVTSQGGSGNYGVVFKIDSNSIASVNKVNLPNGSITLYPNPSSGIFTISFGGEQNQMPATIEVYNVLGEKVFTEILRSAQDGNLINLSNQPNGIYLYRVITQDVRPDGSFGRGSLVGEGKIIVQK